MEYTDPAGEPKTLRISDDGRSSDTLREVTRSLAPPGATIQDIDIE